jgi:hypothetical protein
MRWRPVDSDRMPMERTERDVTGHRKEMMWNANTIDEGVDEGIDEVAQHLARREEAAMCSLARRAHDGPNLGHTGRTCTCTKLLGR